MRIRIWNENKKPVEKIKKVKQVKKGKYAKS